MESIPRSAKGDPYTWLRHMSKFKGSDLFIITNFPPTTKVDGKVTRLTDESLTARRCMEIASSIMIIRRIEESSSTNECNSTTSLPDISRFRVSVTVQCGATTLAFRTIINNIPKFGNLDPLLVLGGVALKKHGLVIFVGNTGSGGPTPLASLIGYRNENTFDHIIAIKGPIESIHQHKNYIITQCEVGVSTENWMATPKNIPHQASDVILIDEIRGRETMDYAIAFAEIGHLCMAMLHVNSTNQALDHIIDLFPEERRTQLLTDLSFGLQVFISQRLVPREGGHGRVAAVEMLLNSPLVTKLVRESRIYKTKEQIKESTATGIQTFDQTLHDLYERGDVSFQDALKNTDSAHDLRFDIQLRSRRVQDAGPGLELI